MQIELFFKVGGGRDCTQYAVLILCHDSTGCDEMGDYFAIEADIMIDIIKSHIVRVT